MYLHYQTCSLLFVGVFVVFVVFIFVVVLGEKRRVFSQSSTHLLLLLKAAGVGHLDVAALGGRFVYDLLQSGVELAVHMFLRRIVARVLFVPRVAAMLCWDLIQDLGFRFLFAREGQFPPAWVRHGTYREQSTLTKKS